MNNQGSKYFSGFLRKHGKMSENDEKGSSHNKEGQKELKNLENKKFLICFQNSMKESQKVKTTPKKMKSREK
jgi:hypothetical protein